jgi:hypothetical protein
MTDTQALKDRIAQLEALLKVAMHQPNPDMGLHNRSAHPARTHSGQRAGIKGAHGSVNPCSAALKAGG